MKRSTSQKLEEKKKITKLASDLGFNAKNNTGTKNNDVVPNLRNNTIQNNTLNNKNYSVSKTNNNNNNNMISNKNKVASLNMKNINYVGITNTKTNHSSYNKSPKGKFGSDIDSAAQINKRNPIGSKIRNNSTSNTMASNFNSKVSNQSKLNNIIPIINSKINLVNKPKIMQENNSKNIKVFSTKSSNVEEKIVIRKNKPMPSEKYTKIKSAEPFAGSKKHISNFGYVYSAGGIPCRIQHGSVKLKLKWDIEPENLDYDPILLVCFEGLLETEHPYNFAASQCIKEMLQARGAYQKVLPVLPKLINPLRMAFSSINKNIFLDTLEIARFLSELVKENLNPYLHFFLQQINKRAFDTKFREKVFDLLRTLESNGGEDALKEIKKKILTYATSY